jgi:hypothetical protein
LTLELSLSLLEIFARTRFLGSAFRHNELVQNWLAKDSNMSAGSPVWPDKSFADHLKPFRNRVLSVSAGRLVFMAFGLCLIAFALAMWLDIIWELPAVARWFITRPGLMIAAGATAVVLWWRSRGVTDERLAHRIDQAQHTGGEILAGWQLATRPTQPAGDFSRAMAGMAANRASARVATIDPKEVIDSSSVKQAAVFTAWVVGALALAWLVMPGIMQHQFNRFFSPNSDLPPYTGLFIELELERSTVLYGQDVLVGARISDKTERVTLIATRGDGSQASVPMLSQGDNTWQAILTRITEPLVLTAHSGSSRSKALQLDVQMTPIILPPTITVVPPEYTRQGIYEGRLPEKGLVGLAGTQVKWNVASNRPLAEGRLHLNFDNGTFQQIALTANTPADGEIPGVMGSMTLERAGRFELSVVDIDGIESHENIKGAITITQDARPLVRIIQPKPMSLATPDINLPVTVIAEDDYGVTSLALYRSLNGSPASKVAAEVDRSKRQQAQWMLPLPKYGLVPGDEIQLFARTEDNDPAGPKGAESPVTVVKIISVADFQKMMVQQRGAESMQAKYQAARRHFDQLANALQEVQAAAAKPESTEAAQELQEKLAAAERIAQEASNAIAELSKQAMPIDVDQELSKTLAEMSKQAAEMAKQLQGMQEPNESESADSKSGLSESEMQELKEMLAAAKGAQDDLTEKAIDPMQKMQKMMPLIVAQQRFEQLAKLQRDLANRLNSLKANAADIEKPETQRRVAELESEQEQLRQALDQLLDDIQRGAEELPDEPELDKLRETALQFAQAVRESQATAEMSSAQENLLGSDFATAQQNAATAADILESFLSECSGMGEGACKNCEAAFKPGSGGAKLRNSIEQMLAMMGMKPGSSPGGKPGMGPGWGQGGGFAQRFPGPQNVGMYGAMPTPQSSPRSGQGDSSQGGVASNHAIESSANNASDGEAASTGNASGQSMTNIPSQYRSQVAEYFRTLSDELGRLEESDAKP